MRLERSSSIVNISASCIHAVTCCSITCFVQQITYNMASTSVALLFQVELYCAQLSIMAAFSSSQCALKLGSCHVHMACSDA